MKKSEKKPPKRVINAIESAGFANLNKLINKNLTVSDACIGCGTCAKVCPKGNISLSGGKALIGTNCIGCMACVQNCPNEVINVGKLTAKRARFKCSAVSVDELCRKVIHID